VKHIGQTQLVPPPSGVRLTALPISCGVLPLQLVDVDREANLAKLMTAMTFLMNRAEPSAAGAC